jgi:hypothetical protein
MSFDVAHLLEFFGAGEAPKYADGLLCDRVIARELEHVDSGLALGFFLKGLSSGGVIEWKYL